MLEEEDKEEGKTKMKVKTNRILLIMIRHGEAWENINPLPNSECEFEYDGQIIQNFDSDLDDKGVDQAKTLNSLFRSYSFEQHSNITWFEALGLKDKVFFFILNVYFNIIYISLYSQCVTVYIFF
jgi:hypothetical protein